MKNFTDKVRDRRTSLNDCLDNFFIRLRSVHIVSRMIRRHIKKKYFLNIISLIEIVANNSLSMRAVIIGAFFPLEAFIKFKKSIKSFYETYGMPIKPQNAKTALI